MTPRSCATLIISILLLSVLHVAAQDMNLKQVLRKHQRARADITKIYSADTLRMRGETEQQGQTYRFALYKKSPNLLRYEITYKEINFIVVYDGKKGYMWTPDEPDRPAELADSNQLRLLEQEAYFEGPLINATKRGLRMEYLGEVELPDHPNPVYHIQLRGVIGDELMDIFVDSISFMEVRRFTRPSEKVIPLVTSFSDFRRVEGFTIPHKIINSYDDDVISTTRVEEADINAGILGFFFSPPDNDE